MTPIKVTINVTRLLREHIYPGKNGKYVTLALFPNRDGEDQFGNTHFVTQDVNKEARQKGIKGPIVGNARVPAGEPPERPRRAASPPSAAKPKSQDPDLDPAEEDIPF